MVNREKFGAPEKTTELVFSLENKIVGWLKRPGEIYLGEEERYAILRGYPKGREPVEYVEPLSLFIRENPSKRKSLEAYIHRPHIILSYIPEHFRIVRVGLLRREKIRAPDFFEIKVVNPDDKSGRNKAQALILLKGRRQIACRFEEIVKPYEGCKQPPCQVRHEDWRAQEKDLSFYDSLIGDPGVIK